MLLLNDKLHGEVKTYSSSAWYQIQRKEWRSSRTLCFNLALPVGTHGSTTALGGGDPSPSSALLPASFAPCPELPELQDWDTCSESVSSRVTCVRLKGASHTDQCARVRVR